MPRQDAGRRKPVHPFLDGPGPDDTQHVTEVRYILTGPRLITCFVRLEDGLEVPAFSYQQYTLTFGDELIGQRLCDVRSSFRDRDIAYIQDLLGPVH